MQSCGAGRSCRSPPWSAEAPERRRALCRARSPPCLRMNARCRLPRCRIEAKLRSLSGAKAYNVLHLRAEGDWITHCKRWENIPDGAPP